MKKLFLPLFFVSVSALATPTNDLNLNANSLKFKVYKMFVSTNANCSNPILVIDNGTSPVETDVKANNPVFGSGSIDNGVYPCVVLEISDTIKYSGEASASGNCSPTTETSRNLCHSGDTAALADGSVVNCTNTEDKVGLFISTNTRSTANGNSFVAPTTSNSNDGVYLASPLTVSGTSKAKFVVNTDGYLCDDQNDSGNDCDGPGTTSAGAAACRLEGAKFSFSDL